MNQDFETGDVHMLQISEMFLDEQLQRHLGIAYLEKVFEKLKIEGNLAEMAQRIKAELQLSEIKNAFNLIAGLAESLGHTQGEQSRLTPIGDPQPDKLIAESGISSRVRRIIKNELQITTLGDLAQRTENDMLSVYRFGMVALLETREILAQHGLSFKSPTDIPASTPPLNDPVLDKSVFDLELTVRSRKCMQRLRIETLRQLIEKHDYDLLGVKDFGETSLNEVKQALAQFGLKLKSLPA